MKLLQPRKMRDLYPLHTENQITTVLDTKNISAGR